MPEIKIEDLFKAPKMDAPTPERISELELEITDILESHPEGLTLTQILDKITSTQGQRRFTVFGMSNKGLIINIGSGGTDKYILPKYKK